MSVFQMFNSVRTCLLCVIGINVCLLGSKSYAQNDYQLRNNPFARAFEDQPKVGYSNAANADGDMDLRAILFDEQRPMVNVGGHILELGDKYAGYIVREIRRDSAIFYRDGRATLLQMEDGDDDIAGYADAN